MGMMSTTTAVFAGSAIVGVLVGALLAPVIAWTVARHERLCRRRKGEDAARAILEMGKQHDERIRKIPGGDDHV